MRAIKIIFSVLASINILTLNAQMVGIGIPNNTPLAALHVKSIDNISDNQALKVSNELDNALLIIQNYGNVGIGRNSAVTRVDIRTSSNTNAIGVGESQQSANAAGAGAIRYEDTQGGRLFLSSTKYNSVPEWLVLDSTPEKAFVQAECNYSSSIVTSVAKKMTSWIKESDNLNLFNNGVFESPRDGVYMVTSAFSFNTVLPSAVTRVVYIEIILNITNDVDSSKNRTYKFVVSSSTARTAGNYSTGANIAPCIQMDKGEKLSLDIYHTTGVSVTLKTVDRRNWLTIREI